MEWMLLVLSGGVVGAAASWLMQRLRVSFAAQLVVGVGCIVVGLLLIARGHP